jgi:hypothetical protein
MLLHRAAFQTGPPTAFGVDEQRRSSLATHLGIFYAIARGLVLPARLTLPSPLPPTATLPARSSAVGNPANILAVVNVPIGE